MNIVNLTPDSFSDGGVYNSSASLKDRLEELNALGVDYLDLGAESTAPLNSAITAEEEISRFQELLFPVAQQIKFTSPLSIDTYRLETFLEVYAFFKKYHSNLPLIWNDISGLYHDGSVEIFFNKCPDSYYILAHTTTSVRDQSCQHMQNPLSCEPQQTVSELINYFKCAQQFLSERGALNRVIFDPCFGFSKGPEHNWQIINKIDQLIGAFPQMRWLLGISKKSFLKALVPAGECFDFEVEILHAAILSQWISKLQNYSVIFRLHDPYLYRGVMASYTLRD